MSLYYLILWNHVDILQKHFKKDHVYMRLWTRFYGMWTETCLRHPLHHENMYCTCVTTWTYVHYQEDNAKSADLTSSSWVVNVRSRHDACTVRAQRDRLSSARLSPQPVPSIKKFLITLLNFKVTFHTYVCISHCCKTSMIVELYQNYSWKTIKYKQLLKIEIIEIFSLQWHFTYCHLNQNHCCRTWHYFCIKYVIFFPPYLFGMIFQRNLSKVCYVSQLQHK